MTIIIKVHSVDKQNKSKGQFTIGMYKKDKKALLGFDYYNSSAWHQYLVFWVRRDKRLYTLLESIRIWGYKPVFEVYEFGRIKGDKSKSPYRNLYPQAYNENGKLLLKEYGSLKDYTRRNNR